MPTFIIIRNLVFSVLLVLSGSTLRAQTSGQDRADQVLNFPGKLLGQVEQQASKAEKRLQQQSQRYLSRLQKKEKKLYKKLYKKDSAQARAVFGNIDSVYARLDLTIAHSDSADAASAPLSYSGKLDSMQTALRFLQGQAGGSATLSNPQYQALQQQYGKLQGQLNQTEHLQKLLQQRRQLLVEKLSTAGVSGSLQRYQKQVYYYQQQVKEYRAALENPQLLEKKALELLSKVPAFQQYFDKFSQLGSMFRLPGQTAAMDPSALLLGLQTREGVLTELNNLLGGEAAAQQAMSSGLQQGQSELSQLKSKLTSALDSGEPVDMPGFKPNTQRGKSFLKRLELGTNLQSQRSNRYFPSTSDIGLSVGYKLNAKSILGIGGSYKVGWGESIRKIRVTHEGIGLRTFLDWKIKGNFWASGGYEWNYRSRFDNLSVMKQLHHWQQSALMGIQLKQPVGKYKTTVSLLYDALWRRQVPQTQPVVFRVGYLFN